MPTMSLRKASKSRIQDTAAQGAFCFYTGSSNTVNSLLKTCLRYTRALKMLHYIVLYTVYAVIENPRPRTLALRTHALRHSGTQAGRQAGRQASKHASRHARTHSLTHYSLIHSLARGRTRGVQTDARPRTDGDTET